MPPAIIHEAPPLLEVRPGMAPELGGHAVTAAPGCLRLLNSAGDVRTLEEIEIEVIRFAISHYRGQMSEVARRLQIGRSTLYRKVENLGLEDGPGSEQKAPVAAG
jgi:DNA-binding NtrC family response regulator